MLRDKDIRHPERRWRHMTNKLVILFTILFPLRVLGQGKELAIPKYKNGDVDYSFLWAQKRAKELKLVDLTQSQTPFRIRLWTTGQVIEVWRDSDSSTAGQILTYTREVDEYGDPKKKQKTYSQINILSTSMASAIITGIDSLNILELRAEDSIPEWKQGTDGYSYMIEFVTETKYVFKYYWGCAYQDSTIMEAVVLENFFNKLKTDMDLKGIQDSFMNGLPNGCYNNDGMVVTCRGKRYVGKRNR